MTVFMKWTTWANQRSGGSSFMCRLDRFWKGCKPNFVCVPCGTERIICLSSQYPKPGLRRGTGRSGVSYLALLPMGFSVPPRLLLER